MKYIMRRSPHQAIPFEIVRWSRTLFDRAVDIESIKLAAPVCCV